MKLYENVSTRAAEVSVIQKTDTHVRVRFNIREEMRPVGPDSAEIPVKVFDEKVFTKDEYIDYLADQLTSVQLALCELYEKLGG